MTISFRVRYAITGIIAPFRRIFFPPKRFDFRAMFFMAVASTHDPGKIMRYCMAFNSNGMAVNQNTTLVQASEVDYAGINRFVVEETCAEYFTIVRIRIGSVELFGGTTVDARMFSGSLNMSLIDMHSVKRTETIKLSILCIGAPPFRERVKREYRRLIASLVCIWHRIFTRPTHAYIEYYNKDDSDFEEDE